MIMPPKKRHLYGMSSAAERMQAQRAGKFSLVQRRVTQLHIN